MMAKKTGEDNPEERVKNRALRMLSARPYSRGELERKLAEKGEEPEMSGFVLDWLEELGYLNDAAYAAEVVRYYAERGYGVGRVRNELYRRRVPRELWDDALDGFPADTEDELDSLLRRRLGSSAADSKELRRAADFLRRRGFGWDEISSALDRYAERAENEEEDDEK